MMVLTVFLLLDWSLSLAILIKETRNECAEHSSPECYFTSRFTCIEEKCLVVCTVTPVPLPRRSDTNTGSEVLSKSRY